MNGIERSRFPYDARSVSVGRTPARSRRYRAMKPVPAPTSSRVSSRSSHGTTRRPSSFSRNHTPGPYPTPARVVGRPGSSDGVRGRALGGPVTLQGLLEHVPPEDGALDPDRVLHHAFQRDELTELVLVGLDVARQHRADLDRERLDVLEGPPRHGLRHHRGRALADRTPLSDERDVEQLAVLLVDEHRDLVAAQWVVLRAAPVRVRHLALVPRPLVVVEDDFLVDVVERHGRLR